MYPRIALASTFLVLFATLSWCQQTVPADPPLTENETPRADSPEAESKRIFGIIPNYRTSPSLQNYSPLTVREKFRIASQDSFDRGTGALALLFGAQSQLANSNPAFGQGVAGFARYFGASYGDFVIGDMMTEALFPVMLRQDPRYFRRGTGSGGRRLVYAMGQIFWTHRDSGGTQFNYSEVIGNATAVAISNAYYADNRTAAEGVSKLGIQLGVDMASNILKEFWPDLERKFRRKHGESAASAKSD